VILILAAMHASTKDIRLLQAVERRMPARRLVHHALCCLYATCDPVQAMLCGNRDVVAV